METLLIKRKSQAALSTFCWGIYMIIKGLSMVIYPNNALATMGFEPTVEIWIRMTGLLALVLGYFYVQMGRYHFTPFYTWKVVGHAWGILIMILFYLQDLVPAVDSDDVDHRSGYPDHSPQEPFSYRFQPL